MKNILITGGAGFIGSNLTQRLLHDGLHVTVFDDFSTGFLSNLPKNNPNLSIIEGSILDKEYLIKAVNNHDTVVHLAANADVRGGLTNTQIDFNQNTLGTYNVLEACRINNVKTIAFSSSATVYGEPTEYPTKETYPAIQTSLYGASKKAGEAMIEAYAEGFGIQAIIYRFVSFIGHNYSHGVLVDFYNKLLKNPNELYILGNGKQQKSYLDVKDGVNAIVTTLNNPPQKSAIYNIGHDEYLTVNDVADTLCDHLKLENVNYAYSGKERGWIGDSPFVHLCTQKLKSLGWSPTLSIKDGIKKTLDGLTQSTS